MSLILLWVLTPWWWRELTEEPSPTYLTEEEPNVHVHCDLAGPAFPAIRAT